MFKLISKIRKPLFLFPLTLCLTLLLCIPWVSAKTPPQPKPQLWQIDGVVAAIDDSNSKVKGDAFQALAGLEPQDLKLFLKKPEDIAQKAINFLKDEKIDSFVRASTAKALGNLGEAAAPYVPDILNFVKGGKPDWSEVEHVAAVLGNSGEAGAKYIPDILNLLKDEKVQSDIRYSAASALGNFGEAAVSYVPNIINFLKDETVDSDVRIYAAGALSGIRKLELKEVIVVLNNFYELNPWNSNFELWRGFTYYLSGGTDEVKTLLKWLGNPQETSTQLKYEDGKKTLEVFLSIWKDCNDLKGLQKDLADKIAQVTRLVTWQSQDITLLQSHYNNLKNGGYYQANTLLLVINNLSGWKWLFNPINAILILPVFLVTLIFIRTKMRRGGG